MSNPEWYKKKNEFQVPVGWEMLCNEWSPRSLPHPIPLWWSTTHCSFFKGEVSNIVFETIEKKTGRKKKIINKLPSQNEIMTDNKWWFTALLKSCMQHESCIVIWVFWLNYFYCLLWHDCTKPRSCRLKETLIKKINILS